MTQPGAGADPRLLVCITCAGGAAREEGVSPPGRLLLDRVAANAPFALQVSGVKCLSACKRGCAAALMQPGKWSYLLGGMQPEHAADLLAYAQAYGASDTGAVPRASRPEALQGSVLGRVPG